LSTIKCKLTINEIVSCELLWLRRRSGNTKTVHQNWKLTPKQRSIKRSESFRGGDATIGSHIITLYFTHNGSSLFDCYLTLLDSVRWSYLLFDIRERHLRCKFVTSWNWSRRNRRYFHLPSSCVSPPIPQKETQD